MCSALVLVLILLMCFWSRCSPRQQFESTFFIIAQYGAQLKLIAFYTVWNLIHFTAGENMFDTDYTEHHSFKLIILTSFITLHYFSILKWKSSVQCALVILIFIEHQRPIGINDWLNYAKVSLLNMNIHLNTLTAVSTMNQNR